MNLHLKDFKNILISAFFVGLITDFPSLSLGIKGIFGFSLIVPLTILLLFSIFNIFNIKNKFLIIFVSTFSFFLAMNFGFWQWIELRNEGNHMSGLLLLIGVIPSIVAGLIFGFFISRKVDRHI